MRLIYFVQYFYPEKASGSDLVLDLLEGYANQGWNVAVYTPMPTRGITQEVRAKYANKRTEKIHGGRVTIHRMSLYREGTGFLPRALRYVIFSFECLWKGLTEPADVIFTGSGPPSQGVIVGLIKKLTGKRFVYNLQDIFPDSLITTGATHERSILMKIGRWMEQFTYRHADAIITISEDMKKNILAKGVPEEKVIVVRNWIDTGRVVPIKREGNKLFDELGLSREKFYVVYAGNLGQAQGTKVIVKAAALLKDNDDIQFVIFGNGSEEELIRSMICDLKLSNVSMYPLQPIERVSEVYSIADVALITCRKGVSASGLPSKTWTIMATGKAIIGSFDTDSELDRTLREAGCGFCVEAGDPQRLVETITSLYCNPVAKVRMNAKAREYAENEVSKEKAVREYVHAIEKVFNSKS